ncbi:reverse transcriptase [Gossypium australe]|uniref:Reverse transcriptase n=1 Tax=Gossypium australe TaxID=47621 RepID=A0A5B6UT74_9ROSI|nr:reverse transcriptase [Gossypium australe]
MPFNFQSLMTVVFKRFIRKLVFVFFDDILWLEWTLVPSKGGSIGSEKQSVICKGEYVQFWFISVEYLEWFSLYGCIQGRRGFELAQPLSIKILRGFFELSEYYKRFIKNYGVMAKPWNALLKKNVD